MLAYYTSLVKKEELLQRISLDLEKLAEIANDLVCEIKVASVNCKEKNLEDAIQKCKSSQELCKIVSAMIKNSSSNLDGYLQTLVPLDKTEPKEEEDEDVEENVDDKKSENQIGSLLEALKSLKEMKDSLNEK